MEHLPKKIHHNGISYTLVGDYYIPDLKLSEEKAGITTGSRPSMRSVGRSCLTSRSGMGCIWIRSRPTVGGSIWKSRTIS